MARKRADGTPAAKTLKMPDWLAAEVELIATQSGMTQAKITSMLEALVFPQTLADELRRRVLDHLAQTLIPGGKALSGARVAPSEVPLQTFEQAALYTPYQLEQAAKYGIDPADVVIPDADTPEIPAETDPGPLPVGEGAHDQDPF